MTGEMEGQKNVTSGLISYFQDHANDLQSAAHRAGILDNKPDIGTQREDILGNFLYRHLPKRCEIIKGGYIFDLSENKSKQMDLIVTNDLTLQFNEFRGNERLGKSFNRIEGCYCALSVKSELNIKELYSSIDNIASIPLEKKLKINPLMKDGEILAKQLPLKIVFAYKGMKVDNALEGIIEFSKEHELSEEQWPDMIIVNNSYFIWKVDPEGRTTYDGVPLKFGSFIAESRSNYIGGLALLQMLTKIQRISNFGTSILMSFDAYVDKSYSTLIKSNQSPAQEILSIR
jgi:hypothetical protein